MSTPEKQETGAIGDESKDPVVPFQPNPDDETPLGDTDQHSKVDHSKDPAEDIEPGAPSDD